MQSVELLKLNKVEFNILCVLSTGQRGEAEGTVPLLPLAGHR